MGYKEYDIRIPVNISEQELRQQIVKKCGIKNFDYKILLKSLDARNKGNIFWQYRVGLCSHEISSGMEPVIPNLSIPRKKYTSKVLVIGSGPAGIFAALVLAEAGIKVTLIERGSAVMKRKKAIEHFETTGTFNAENNYAFGEGGAGTFSDGKLTSRTKGLSLEKNYIFDWFIKAGAPQEILYMTHPHLGSDKLTGITEKLRKAFLELGGEVVFNCSLIDFVSKNNRIFQAKTTAGTMEADYFLAAPGHSAYETYRMFIRRGIPFQTKNFAIGMRAEHHQTIINKAQWGVDKLPGVKAAEYRLTANSSSNKPVYSFCMCPGGIIVPATAYAGSNIVNGMSLYSRNNTLANAAVVAGIHPSEILGENCTPENALEWLESLEQKFYNYSGSYNAPAVSIHDFLQNKPTQKLPESSFPFELIPADINELLPPTIIQSMKDGLTDFNRKLRAYETGILVGLESKTSSPVQVVRDKENFTAGFDNFYLAGEGSGWAGGIVSSAADGIKSAMAILKNAK